MNYTCEQIFGNNKEGLERLQSYFKTAEKHLKIVERKKIILGSDLAGPDITVIEDLSNAAYYTIEALVEKDAAKQKDLLIKAQNYCGNAGFEALKMSLMDMLKEVYRFRKKYRKDIIANSIPNWITRFGDIKKIPEELHRIKIQGEAGKDYYEYAKEENKKLLALVEDIQIYEPKLREKRRDRIIGERVYKIWFIFGLISLFLNFIMTYFKPPAL